MNPVKKLITVGIAFLSINLLLAGCDNNTNPLSLNSDIQLKKDKTLTTTSKVLEASVSDQFQYPISTSKITYYKKNRDIYMGGDIDLLPTNSVFDFDGGSLTPPPSIVWGDPVEITFSVDKDPVNNELVFSFGPSGCQFDPPARVILDYSELGIENPKLFYIESDGSYQEQTPDHIDTNGKWLTLKIDHFSRYAVAYGN